MITRNMFISFLAAVLILLMSTAIVLGQQSFFYARGKKLTLGISSSEISVRFKPGVTQSQIAHLAAGEFVNSTVIPLRSPAADGFQKIKFSGLSKAASVTGVLQKLKNSPEVAMVEPVYLLDDSLEAVPYDRFLVQFEASVSKSQIDSLNKAHNVRVIGISTAAPNLYTLQVTDSSDLGVLAMSNAYYQGLPCEWAKPDFFIPGKFWGPPNDPYYSDQWYLHNTGQNGGTPGADIDAPDAWDVTKGSSSITVAVIDEGGEAHEDIPSNRIVPGYDYYSLDNNPSPGGNEAHGMACAGIIVATQNNGKGISGIAPNSDIMFLKIANAYSEFAFEGNVANAIDYAWQHGASILSDSWGYYPTTNPQYYPDIVDAINRALTQGRSGKGSVVVFAAGNTANRSAGIYGGLAFPANLSGVIAVGATDSANGIQWYSPRGAISVVAPSGNLGFSQPNGSIKLKGDIWSTDIPGEPGWNDGSYGIGSPTYYIHYTWNSSGGDPYPPGNYTSHHGGTSAACPQVAAVAALILAVNPDLTQSQVANIIESTAVDLGSSGYDNDFGYGRLNAYDAVVAALPVLPNTISSNTTLTGKNYKVNGVVRINSSTLTVPAGVHFFLASDAEIVAYPGSKIIANGTSSDPITFTRLDPDGQWNTVALQGDGSQFTWCLFDGASTNVSVESRDDVFSHCTFRHGWRGIGTWWDQQNPNATTWFTMNYCMIEDNQTVAAVIQHADVAMHHCTIQGNGSAGLYLYDSGSDDFFYNLITGNDTNTNLYPGRDGIEVVGGSDVELFQYNGVNYAPGQNRIANNPGDQIYVQYGTSLIMGIDNSPDWGWNGVFGGSGYRVDNQSGSTVEAPENWWGTSSPTAGLFSGSVDYADWLHFDPTGSAGVGSGNYPHSTGSLSPAPLVMKKSNRYDPGKAGSDAKFHVVTTTSSFSQSERAWRRARIDTLREQIAGAADASVKMKKLEQIYRLHLMSLPDSTFAEPLQKDRVLWGGMIQGYLSGNRNSGFSAAQAERLMLMDEHEAYRSGRYSEAGKKMARYAPYITSSKGKISLMIDRANLADRQGDYQQELTLLDNVKQAEVQLGTPEKQVDARYAVAIGSIRSAMKRATTKPGTTGPETPQQPVGTDTAKPTVTALQPAYPNPFNPTTTIRYQLARTGPVKLTVWNILGRRVATLVNGTEQKGAHQVIFDASQLASGVYFYRLRAGDKVLVKKMLLMK